MAGALGMRAAAARVRCRRAASPQLSPCSPPAPLGFGYAAAAGRCCVSPMRCPPNGRARTSRSSASSTTLPQFSARGTRFAFAVERTQTRDAIVPERVCRSPGTRSRERTAPRMPFRRSRAGERWQLVVRLKRPHGTRQPARLRRRSVAPRERDSRDGLRARRRAQPAGRTRSPAGRPTTSFARASASARAFSRPCPARRMRA